jgi:hypothetical protein
MAEVPCSEKQTAGELDLDPDVELEVAVEEDPSVDRYSPHVDAEFRRKARQNGGSAGGIVFSPSCLQFKRKNDSLPAPPGSHIGSQIEMYASQRMAHNGEERTKEEEKFHWKHERSS